MSPFDAVPSRRNFLRETAGAAAILASGIPVRHASAAPTAKIADIRVISQTPDFYCGWPTLTRRANGQLVVVYSGGRERHVCPFGRVEMMRSDDSGATWSWPRTLLDSPLDDRDAGVVETSQGSLLVTTFTSLAYKSRLEQELKNKAAGHREAWTDKHLRKWQAVHDRLPAQQREAELGQWMIRSTDGGITWSARYGVPVDSPHGPIQLANGRLLYAGKELWTDARKASIYSSDNDGVTWKWLADMPVRDGDDVRDYHELHAVETDNGKLVVQIRNHNQTNHRETLQSESTDGGRSWTTPHSIGVWGLPSHLLKLRDSRLLMSYGYRRPPYGNQARVSDNEGSTWSEPITLSDDGAGGDLGYPSTVQLDDDSLVTVWYEKMAGSFRAVLRQARWSLAV